MDLKENVKYKYWCDFLEWQSKEILCYGEILTDDGYEVCAAAEADSYTYESIRIRTIKYNNHIYYHKMINGEVIEVKELM